ncbi:helix-turn-helix domain-containing protein [Paraburkholderia hayleyella]|uniref:helix-turn-helix domain-containing protein n=1 Tax=Paraburkholderia hayleyella TaxID=2152889 RepID=UPI0012911F33|nr:RodZ domain-containing protein [Paraburkholderia hayleyella]
MSESRQPHEFDTGANADHLASVTGHSAVPSGGLDSLLEVGARLTQLREAKGWSIDDVSARLKVAAIKLRALEAGDISHLPDATFALGVVRGYAKMLGADPAPFAQALRRENGAQEPDLSMPASSGKDLPRGRAAPSLGGTGRHRSWLWGIAVVFIALIALAVWHTNGSDAPPWFTRFKAGANGANGAGQSTAAAAAAVPPAALPVPASASAPVTAAAGADAGSTVVPAPAALPASTSALPSSATVAVPATAASMAVPDVPSSAVVTTSEASLVASSPVAGADTLKAGEAIVSLRVTQDSWFSVRQQDGKELFSGLVPAGETKAVAGVAPFRITVGNRAGLESISLDGKPVDPAKFAAAKGNVARFVLP